MKHLSPNINTLYNKFYTLTRWTVVYTHSLLVLCKRQCQRPQRAHNAPTTLPATNTAARLPYQLVCTRLIAIFIITNTTHHCIAIAMTGYGTMMQGPGRPRKQGGPWTTAENDKLAFLVNQFVNKSQVHWVEIAREHGTRDAKQCRERWDNHLKPGLNREKISDAEGDVILKWVRDHGKHWAPLGRLVNRPENMVKNYFYQENKKAERGVIKHRRNENRRASHSRLSTSVPMSRDNSGSSSHHTYGRSSASPTYAPAQAEYHPANHRAAGPYYPYPSASQYPAHQYPSRRTSVASNATNPPSLTPDQGSPAESPRAEIPYPQGQFSLPQYMPSYPQPIEMPLSSPHDIAEGAGHKRSNSASSYGSLYSNIYPHSPTARPIPTGFLDRQRQLPPLTAFNALALLDRRHTRQTSRSDDGEEPARKKGSDARMSISNLLS